MVDPKMCYLGEIRLRRFGAIGVFQFIVNFEINQSHSSCCQVGSRSCHNLTKVSLCVIDLHNCDTLRFWILLWKRNIDQSQIDAFAPSFFDFKRHKYSYPSNFKA